MSSPKELETVSSNSKSKTTLSNKIRNRLFTNEDPFHLHKTLGITVLLHFSYRLYCMIRYESAFPMPPQYYTKTKTYTLTDSTESKQQYQESQSDSESQQESLYRITFFLSIHLVLHCSSFFFNVPRRQIHGGIWKEYRLHNLFFATRHIVGTWCMVVGQRCTSYMNHLKLKDFENSSDSESVTVSITESWSSDATFCSTLRISQILDFIDDVVGLKFRPLFLRILLIYFTMVFADLSTYYFSSQDQTIRGMPWPPTVSQVQKDQVHLFYAMCQFGATIMSGLDPSLSFFCLIGIEGGSFLKTLWRKNVINIVAGHRYYTVCLFLLFPFVVWPKRLDYYVISAIMFSVAAFTYRCTVTTMPGIAKSKYVVWPITVLLHDFSYNMGCNYVFNQGDSTMNLINIDEKHMDIFVRSIWLFYSVVAFYKLRFMFFVDFYSESSEDPNSSELKHHKVS